MNVSLVMFKADGNRRDFPLTKSHTVVGRKNDCGLRIPLSSVSRQHCEVTVDSGQVKVRDLGSSNGTYHNSVRIQEAVLSPGDEIVVGPVVFTVVVDGEPSEINPVRTIVEGENGDAGQSPLIAEAASSNAPTEIETDDELPVEVEPELHSPTVDLDDPIAALEAMADDEGDDDIDILDDLELLSDDDDDR